MQRRRRRRRRTCPAAPEAAGPAPPRDTVVHRARKAQHLTSVGRHAQGMPEPLTVVGALRRIRRLADMSQRELADALGVSRAAVSHAEAGRRDLSTGLLARAAALAGLRLALLDATGDEVDGMAEDTARDGSGRRFPAHLDTMLSEQRWSRWAHRFDRPQPTYSFDRDRSGRDRARRESGTPHDHHRPQPGDSPADRAARRKMEARRRAVEERERRFLSGELRELPAPFECTCPAVCDELDDREGKPVHAPSCGCDCDLA